MKKQKGFTLLELTMVVAVITILSVYAVPSFKVSMVNNRLIAETTNMTSILNLARAESVPEHEVPFVLLQMEPHVQEQILL